MIWKIILGVILCQNVMLLTADATDNLYCKEDKDCKHLGGLKCIKSMCEWGICGCPNDYASKYLGQKKKYQCVKLKKVGEKCSVKDDDGICAVANSFCNESRCACFYGKEATWRGERCDDPTARFVGETCTSPRQCSTDNSVCTIRTTVYDHTNNIKPECICEEGFRIAFSNAYHRPHRAFLSRNEPLCIRILHGDPCMQDEDCPGGMACNPSFVCGCKEDDHVPNYERNSCRKGLSFHAKCYDNDGHCDGSKGLTCGDHCAITGMNTREHPNRTCVCGPFHKTNGASCTPIKENDACYGDYNCKGWSLSAVCVDGKCKGGAQAITISSLLFLLISAVIIA